MRNWVEFPSLVIVGDCKVLMEVVDLSTVRNSKYWDGADSVLKPLILFCDWRGLIKESSR